MLLSTRIRRHLIFFDPVVEVAYIEEDLPVGPHGIRSDSVERAFARAGVQAPLFETGRYLLYNRDTKKTYPFIESL